MAWVDEQRFVELMAQTVRTIVAEQLDGKFQEFEARMDGKFEKLEDRLTARLDTLEAGLNDLRGEMAALRSRVGLIKEAVDSLEESMTDVKRVLTYPQDKWVEHDREIWSLKRKA